LFLIVSSVSFEKFVLTVFFSFGFFWTGAAGITTESQLIGGLAGVNTNAFSQVGHGTVCPVPSAGYSMDCPQCGHAHL
jgi:hypothetical protein